MKVLVTGADGFIGRNLRLHLLPRQDVEIVTFTRGDPATALPERLEGVDFVFHLAGVNRPQDPAEFETGNRDLTASLCEALAKSRPAAGHPPGVIFCSSTQAALDNPYGRSKRAAEDLLRTAAQAGGCPVAVFRLPGVFGKWCRPNYNSVVATFCHNIARGLPIQVNASGAPLRLVYVDDVVQEFVRIMDGGAPVVDAEGFAVVAPEYQASLTELAAHLRTFRDSRETLTTERVGTGLLRALHATYLSYLPTAAFAYPVPRHGDQRGVFVEMLKTQDSGQFSFFTAHPGVTRGGHYHHSKTEKFLVIQGHARFRFRHMDTGETHQLDTSGAQPQIVETVPGWTHDITNVGEQELVVMLWANEVFDRSRPDTFSCPL